MLPNFLVQETVIREAGSGPELDVDPGEPSDQYGDGQRHRDADRETGTMALLFKSSRESGVCHWASWKR